MGSRKKIEGVTARDSYVVHFTNLKIEETNLRYDYGELKELAENIKINGVKKSLIGIKKGDFFYVKEDGFRRYFAMEILYKKYKIDTQCRFEIMMVETNTPEETALAILLHAEGKPLTPLEQAEGVRRLIDLGWSAKQISDRWGKSQAYVSRLQALLKAPVKAIEYIKGGKLSAATVIDLVSSGKIEDIIQDIDAGNYEQQEEQGDSFGPESPAATSSEPAAPKKKTKTISKVDIQKREQEKTLNSWAELKRFVNGRDLSQKIKDPAAAKTFLFVSKIMSNELTARQIENFFK